MTDVQHETVIIGAGLAGLTAGLHLAERGLPPLILEAETAYLGGRVKGGESIDVNGWTFRMEHGIHGIWSPYRNLQAMLGRRKIRPVWVPAQEERWIYRRGDQITHANVGSAIRRSPIPAPFHYLNLFFRLDFLSALGLADLLSLVGIWSGLLYALGVDPLAENQPLQGLRLIDIIKNWPPALKAFFIGLTRSGLAGRPEDIPLSGYIAFMRFYTVLRRDAWMFSYMPDDAGTCLVEPLAAEALQLGATIQKGTRAISLDQTSDGWEIHCRSNATDSPYIIRARHIVLAVDAQAARTLLNASPSLRDTAQSLQWPKGMESAIIRIWFDSSPRPGAEAGIFSGNFILDNYFWLDRIQNSYIEWHRATGGSALEAHIYGPPELLAESDSLLLSRAINDVQSAFPEMRAKRIHQSLQRNPPTHTLFSLAKPEEHLGTETPWANLFACGDWVRHPAPCLFLERATLTGIEAANAVLKKTNHQPWPLIPYLPPEPLAGAIARWMTLGRRARRKRAEKDLKNV